MAQTDPTAEDSVTAQELFDAAAKLSPEERDTFLDETCGRGTALRLKIEQMLEAETKGQLPSGFPFPDTREGILRVGREGDSIGRYKLLQRIGEGGFGEVWMAEQKEPVKRRVALKIIKLGMDTKQVVARFEAERQALALMDHPNIAKVFDGGATENGRPYFVMELVKGVPITEYCETNNIGAEERLKLFIQICHAIQHAHQKGIIHRDIKPSNVLVTSQEGTAVPKVIDFGIAKATQQQLTDKTLVTQLQHFIGTPAYMSPEQAEMTSSDIDTRTDIYSLGVLLYELLTRTTPFDTKELLKSGLDEMRRIIRQNDPPRPSARLRQSASLSSKPQLATLHSSLSTDLDWIVMKCLEKDRTRRYETANGLALDVQHYLDQEPIAARPPSSSYRFKKLVLRNKAGFAGSGVALVALFAAVIFSSWSAVRARRAERSEKVLRGEAVSAREKAEAATLQARRNLYAADMLLAYQAEAQGNLGRARNLLRKYSGEESTGLRGWEWAHLANRVRGGQVRTLRGHTAEVPIVLWTPDGKRLFSGGADGTFRFWDTERGVEIDRWTISGTFRSAAISPDGRFIALLDFNSGVLRFLEASSRGLVRSFTNSWRLSGASFSPDGSMFAVADHRNVLLYRVPEFVLLKTISRDGDFSNFTYGTAFSPDGRDIAYSHGDHSVRIHRIASGTERRVAEMPATEASALAFSSDGRYLAASDMKAIVVCDLRSTEPPRLLTDHREQILKVAFTPDGKTLVSASGDQTLRYWDTKSWSCIRICQGHEHEVQAMAISPDGHWIASGSKDETIRIWDATQRRSNDDSPVFSLGSLVRPGSDRFFVSSSSNEVAPFNLATLREGPRHELPMNITTVAMSRDLKEVALVLDDKTVEIRDSDRWVMKKRIEASLPIFHVALSDSKRLLAINDKLQNLRLIDIESGGQIFSLADWKHPATDTGFSWGLQFRANDTLLLRLADEGDSNREITLIEVPSGRRRTLPLTHKGGQITNYALSGDGTLLATTAFDGLVKLWAVSDLKELASFSGQLVGFNSVAFSPGGDRLAAGGWDGTIMVWDVPSKQQVAMWKAHPRVCLWLQFLGDGSTLASVGQIGRGEICEARVWPGGKTELAF